MNISTTVKVKDTSTLRDCKVVKAEYQGGPYISLTFGYLPTPTEVINVWDYATDAPEDPDLRSQDRQIRRVAVRKQVFSWIETQDEEWPEWYDGYLENGGY